VVKELIDIVYEHGHEIVSPQLVGFVGPVLQGIDKIELIETFINSTYMPNEEFWTQINQRQEVFFYEHANSIFKQLPMNNVNAFKTLMSANDDDGNQIITAEDREVLWDFFGTLIKICIHYVHEGRKPKLHDGKPRYTKKFFDHISIETHAKTWNVKLNFSS